MLADMVRLYFKTARERERIRRLREAGNPFPWSTDPVLTGFRFCNVRREDDRTTVWFREELRDPLRDNFKAVLLATVAFRIFNLIETGEVLAPMLLRGEWDSERVIKEMAGRKKIVTGAHMVHSPWGYTKLPGCCRMVELFLESGEDLHGVSTLEEAWTRLVKVPFLGPFTAYEIVSDLRWTCVLEHATDINSWANPGPGCQRGLSHLTGEPVDMKKAARERYIGLMRQLLKRSRAKSNWPHEWPAWEMREVEHWLCEFDKYCRGLVGGRLKRRFKP
jgi:hypothetical protein